MLKFFDQLKTYPNQASIWEIIDHGKAGKIIDLSDEAVLLIENCAEPFAFIAGYLGLQEFEYAIDTLKNYEHPLIYCDPKYYPLFLKAGYEFHLRVELNLEKLIPYESESLNILKIDSATQAQSLKLKENFSKYNYGYVLLNDNIVVSEAYATIGREYGELSVYTHSDYRKNGYSKIILANLIKDCVKNNIIPIYSRQVDNKASLFTALSLGFTVNRYYTLMVPDFGNILCSNLAKWLRENKDYSI